MKYFLVWALEKKLSEDIGQAADQSLSGILRGIGSASQGSGEFVHGVGKTSNGLGDFFKGAGQAAGGVLRSTGNVFNSVADVLSRWINDPQKRKQLDAIRDVKFQAYLQKLKKQKGII